MSSERIDTEAVLANGKAWQDTVRKGSPIGPIECRWMAFLDPCVAALEQERSDAEALRHENEQWRAQYMDDTAPQVRPMTHLEHAAMDMQGELGRAEERIRLLERAAWWDRMSAEDIAAELSGTFDLGLSLTRRIAEWIVQEPAMPESPAAASEE